MRLALLRTVRAMPRAKKQPQENSSALVPTPDPDLAKKLKQNTENQVYDSVVSTLKYLSGGK